jgi:hypothetical protein
LNAVVFRTGGRNSIPDEDQEEEEQPKSYRIKPQVRGY